LLAGYRDILFHPNPEKEVDKLFTIMDVNKDGFIDYKGKLSKLKEFCN
jgi:Ca2+-binding EF-hand superfamily protein